MTLTDADKASIREAFNKEPSLVRLLAYMKTIRPSLHGETIEQRALNSCKVEGWEKYQEEIESILFPTPNVAVVGDEPIREI